MAHKKIYRHPRFEPLTLRIHGQRPSCYPSMFLVYIDRDWYVPICTNRRLDILRKERKQNPLPRDYASTAEAARGRVERDEQGEARRANTTPNGGPHLELERLRLKTWSKSDFSIAETWPTICIYTYIYTELQISTSRIRVFCNLRPLCLFRRLNCWANTGLDLASPSDSFCTLSIHQMYTVQYRSCISYRRSSAAQG